MREQMDIWSTAPSRGRSPTPPTALCQPRLTPPAEGDSQLCNRQGHSRVQNLRVAPHPSVTTPAPHLLGRGRAEVGAPVRIEAAAFGDPRFELLGQLCGYNRHEALGRMACLWSLCTDRQEPSVDRVIVSACLGPAGPDAIVSAGLGEVQADGRVRVRGSARLDWLANKRAAAKEGGKARAGAARDNGGRYQPPTSQTPATDQPDASHRPARRQPQSALAPPDSSPLVLVPVLSLSPEEKDQRAQARTRPSRAPSGDHQTFVARFTELFQAKNLGKQPDWKAKEKHGMVKTLLAKEGGLAEALKRAENMFCAPPSWPPPPFELATLVKHWDRFAQPHAPGVKTGHYKHTGEETYAGGEVDL
jgi:hypothetical protein